MPFIIAGFFYVLTNPAAWFAVNLFRVAAVARLLHTFVYAIFVLPQPARAIAFFVPFLVTAFMAVSIILYFL